MVGRQRNREVVDVGHVLDDALAIVSPCVDAEGEGHYQIASHAARFVGKQILRHRLFTFHSARRAFKDV